MGFDPMTIALISSVIQAGGSVLGGMAGNRGPKETKQQRTTRKTGDELLASLKGEGPYNDLFQTDENAFQRSIVDPSMSRFRNLIAPQIMGQYSAQGLQNSTGMEDALKRAGVDLNSNIDQLYLPFMQGGQNNMMNSLNSILGLGAGAVPQMSGMEKFGQSASGYLSSDSFGNSMNSLMSAFGNQNRTKQPTSSSITRPLDTPKGFSSDWYGS